MSAHRRKRDSSGHVDPYFQRRRRYRAVLEELLLDTAFDRMPRRAQEAFMDLKFPDPVLEFDDSVPDDEKYRTLRKKLEAEFREVRGDLYATDISVRDFLSVVWGLTAAVRSSIPPGFPPAGVEFFHLARPVLDMCFAKGNEQMWLAWHAALIVPLVASSRLDTRMLCARVIQEETAKGKSLLRLRIEAATPENRRVELDGESRPVVRVATSNGWNDLQQLSWDAQILGRKQIGTQIPVYIQSHGLRQLHARVNLESAAEYLESWLYDSLKDPVIVERTGEDLLVEYRIHQDRLGYLIVTPMEDCAVVRTFKFLTMENTPEARKLKERLRLTRRDVDWLGLSELSAFTQTDLKSDAQLRGILEECGCGHLFDLAYGDFAPQSKALAAEMRKYLRMAA